LGCWEFKQPASLTIALCKCKLLCDKFVEFFFSKGYEAGALCQDGFLQGFFANRHVERQITKHFAMSIERFLAAALPVEGDLVSFSPAKAGAGFTDLASINLA
jgi:hypothetical protein